MYMKLIYFHYCALRIEINKRNNFSYNLFVQIFRFKLLSTIYLCSGSTI